MAAPVRKSADCLPIRPGIVVLRADIRAPLKDAMIDIAFDQGRLLRDVVQDACAEYAYANWQREEPIQW